MDKLVLDDLDLRAAKAFEGYIVRKDLLQRFKQHYPVPTYVVEFLLGRYCSSIDEKEIGEGLEIVERQLTNHSVKAGREELIKSRAREKGSVRLIDLISARLDSKTDTYLARLPSIRIKDARMPDTLATDAKYDRMFTGGFYAEVELRYTPDTDGRLKGRPFSIESIREIQLAKSEVLETLYRGRAQFSVGEWKHFLLRSMGFEPSAFSQRAQDLLLLRTVPLVERNYNFVEIGPRGTGKSHLFQQISPYAHLVSGGKATVAKMFVDNTTDRRGLLCQYDVVCFNEVSGISFDQKDGVNTLKGYMESGEFSRGKESIRAEGSVVMVGNFEKDLEHQLQVGHLFMPLPPEMRNDVAFLDRIHSYLAGWDVPPLHRLKHLTAHFGLVSDFFTECWSQLRVQSRISSLQQRIRFGSALSGRDLSAVEKTVSGLLKIVYPDPEAEVPDEELAWAVRLALEARRRVKEQQKKIGARQYRQTTFTFIWENSGQEEEVVVGEEALLIPTAEVVGRTRTGQPTEVVAVAASPSLPPPPAKDSGHDDFAISEEDLLNVAHRLAYCGRGIEIAQLRIWLKQFGSPERIRLAFLLIRRLAERGFVAEGGMVHAMETAWQAVEAKRKTLGGGWKKNPQGEKTNLCMTYLDSEIKSGADIAREMRKRYQPGFCASPDKLESWVTKQADNDPILLIVDDFAGTGGTVSRGISELKQTLAESPAFVRLLEERRVVCALLFAFSGAVAGLREKHPDVEILTATVFGDDLLALNPNANIFKDGNELDVTRAMVRSIGKDLARRHPLGWGDLGALVCFHNTIPNNTLPIFWGTGRVNGKDWRPLFHRAS